MKIAQVSLSETGGGAERVATDLHDCFLEMGHDAVLLTPRPDPESERAGVQGIDVDAGWPGWQRGLMRIDRRLARPAAAWRRRRGFDDAGHPWTAGLLDLLPWGAEATDVLHLHNLHGGWFDLRALAVLSKRVRTVVTLHDGWLPLGGPHCVMHVAGWDASALRANAALREEALRDAELAVVAPSRWMKRVWDASRWSLFGGDAVVIPNGIDLEVFGVDGPAADRHALGMGGDRRLLMQVGLTGRGVPSHTDPGLALRVLPELEASGSDALGLLNVGEALPVSGLGLSPERMPVFNAGVVRDRFALASLYRTADVLLHAVHEDNFPSVVLEAMACGLPVVAAGVGGIAEQVEDGVTGWLYGKGFGDPAAKLREALGDVGKRVEVGAGAAERARDRFDRRRMAGDYLGLYAELLGG